MMTMIIMMMMTTTNLLPPGDIADVEGVVQDVQPLVLEIRDI